MVAVGAPLESTVTPTAPPFALREKPLCVDLFCGLGGWAHGFLSEGYDVIGFDIERHQYGDDKYPGHLVIQDVLTLDGRQFRNAAVIVASPPCQFFSRMAMPFKMPWKHEEFERRRNLALSLFWACFRISREAEVPLIVENVVGTQKWVGDAAWHYRSFYLWGDIPALMPIPADGQKNSGGSWFGQRDGKALERNDPRDMRRNENGEWSNAAERGGYNHPGKVYDGVKMGGGCFHDSTNNLIRKASSRSAARKAASAQIAKIPFPLAQHIARVFKPYPLARTEDRAVQTELVRSAKA